MTTIIVKVKADKPTSLLDGTAGSGQKVVPIVSTEGFTIGDIVHIIDNLAEEVNEILTIQEGISLTMKTNLENTYTVAETAKVAGHFNVSASLMERIDLWLKATDGVGSFSVKLDNRDNKWFDIILADDVIEVKLDNVTILMGYIDKAFPVTKGTDKMNYEAIGRDYGQDLHNKIVNKEALDWAFPPTSKADDIIEEMLTLAGAEITFDSPSTAPLLAYADKGEEYLIEAIRKIAEQVEYDFYVDKDKVFQFFPIGTIVSGIELDATAEDPSANIVGPIKTTRFDAFELRNRIIVKGVEITDGWTEGNVDDWGFTSGNTKENDYTETAYPSSTSSIKCYKGTSEYFPELFLSFPRHNYDYLPLDLFDETELSIYARMDPSDPSPFNFPMFECLLMDTNNSIIRRKYHVDESRPWNKWFRYVFPVGAYYTSDHIDNHTVDPSYKWKFFNQASQDAGFNWRIKRITFIPYPITGAYGHVVSMNIDGLTLPLIMIAIAQDSGEGSSQTLYKRRDYPITARDITSQIELDIFAEKQLGNRKDPIGSIKLVAQGSVGLIGGANKWIPGHTLRLTSPDDGYNYQLLRMTEIHHIVQEIPDEDGHDWKVEVTLVPYNMGVSGGRLSYNESPEVALFREMSRRIRFLERSADVSHVGPPPSAFMSPLRIDWMNVPKTRIVGPDDTHVFSVVDEDGNVLFRIDTVNNILEMIDASYRLKESVGENWVDFYLQLVEEMGGGSYNPFFRCDQGIWFNKDVMCQGFFGSASRIYVTFQAGGYTPCVPSDVGKRVMRGVDYVGHLSNYDNDLKKWWILPYVPILTAQALTIPDGTGAGTTNINWVTQPGGGALILGHGFTAVDDMPRIVAGSSLLGFDVIEFLEVDGTTPAKIKCGVIDSPSINGAGIPEKGSDVTNGSGDCTVVFDEEFGSTPLVFVQGVDAAAKGIVIDVVSKSTTQFVVKARKVTSVPFSDSFQTDGPSATATVADSSHYHLNVSVTLSINGASAGTPSGSIGGPSGTVDVNEIWFQQCPSGHDNCQPYDNVPVTVAAPDHIHTFSGNAMAVHGHTGTGSGETTGPDDTVAVASSAHHHHGTASGTTSAPVLVANFDWMAIPA